MSPKKSRYHPERVNGRLLLLAERYQLNEIKFLSAPKFCGRFEQEAKIHFQVACVVDIKLGFLNWIFCNLIVLIK